MRGADGIDVVPLHGQDVLQHLFFGRRSAMIAGKLMPVDSVKNQPLSIQANQAVHDFDSPKSHFLPNDFLQRSFLVDDPDVQIVKIRLFCAPEMRLVNLFRKRKPFRPQDFVSAKRERAKGASPFSPHLHLHFQQSLRQIFLQKRTNLQVIDMYLRHRVEEHITENPGKPVKILVLTPASGCPFKDLYGQLVFSLPYKRL